MHAPSRRSLFVVIGLVAVAAVVLRMPPAIEPSHALAQNWHLELPKLAMSLQDDAVPKRVERAGANERGDANENQRGRRSADRFTPELIERCIEVASDIDPELARELSKKRDANPDEFAQAMRESQAGRGLLSMAQLKHRDPHLYQLKISEMSQSLQINRTAMRLQEAIKKGDEAQVAALTEQLRQMLQIEMAMSIKARCEYLVRIEEQVKALREEIEHDSEQFNRIVEGKLAALIKQPPQNDLNVVIPAAANGSSGSAPARDR